jgi:sterol desaturase/sphingolipid hydroxylase (fatty acid hydroxylase superfamily)
MLVNGICKAVDQVALVQEPYIRLGIFGGVFLIMAVWELAAPRRQQAIDRRVRWPSNVGIAVLDALLVRVVFPTTAVGLALVADASGWGLFHLITLPAWIAIVASVILLDLAIYLQHVLFHAVPALWRLHRMHHADLAFDVTTGFRFHPIEILLSMLIKLATIAALGTPAIAVLAFEVLLNATSMFNHGNVLIPQNLDRVLRWVVVTPDMHRVHHSIRSSETNSNFGFNLPWWDRLFGTYRPQPSAGQSGMTIGIEQFRDVRELRLDRMLIQPFHNEVGNYPFGHRQNER